MADLAMASPRGQGALGGLIQLTGGRQACGPLILQQRGPGLVAEDSVNRARLEVTGAQALLCLLYPEQLRLLALLFRLAPLRQQQNYQGPRRPTPRRC